MGFIDLLWLFIILVSLQPAIQRSFLEISRQRALSRLASERVSTVITLIHRQETMSFLGFPIVRYINIDDAEGVLGAIRETPSGTPIDIVLHTPGGLVLAASQIASALADGGKGGLREALCGRPQRLRIIRYSGALPELGLARVYSVSVSRRPKSPVPVGTGRRRSGLHLFRLPVSLCHNRSGSFVLCVKVDERRETWEQTENVPAGIREIRGRPPRWIHPRSSTGTARCSSR